MSEAPQIKVGNFVVIRRPYRYAVVTVTKATAKQFEATGEWSDRARRYDYRTALFSGAKDKAEKLFEQLTSSAAQFDEDERKARERQEKRDAKFIEDAMR